MIVGGVLAKAGMADSANAVLTGARLDRSADPSRALSRVEAVMRALAGETNEAVELLEAFRAVNPDHAFEFEGARAPLVGQQGIWKPRQLALPISVRTTPPIAGKPAPYDDKQGDDGTLLYRYIGTNVDHRSNVGMRRLMDLVEGAMLALGLSSNAAFDPEGGAM